MRCDVQVLQLVPSLAIGGLERVAVHLCMGLRERFRVGAACLKGEGAFADELRAHGIPVFSWGERRGRGDAYSAPFRLRRLLKGSPVQILHTHNTAPLYNGTLAQLGNGGFALIHTDHARDFPVERRTMIGERFCAHRAFRVVAVSEHSKRNLVTYEHIRPDHIDVIPNGVDLAPFRTLPLPFQRDGEPVVFGTVARFTEQKALHVLLDAAAILRRDGLAFEVRLAGDGPCRVALEAQASRLGLSGCVRFLGYRSDVADVLAGMDVFVLSSKWEGMPLSVLEAMGAGRPIIATAVGGVPEVVESDAIGLLVPPGAPDALAAAVRTLADDRARGRRMAAAARARAEERFSLEAMSAAYGDLYDAALRGAVRQGTEA